MLKYGLMQIAALGSQSFCKQEADDRKTIELLPFQVTFVKYFVYSASSQQPQ